MGRSDQRHVGRAGSSGLGEDAVGIDDALCDFIAALLGADDRDGVPASGAFG